MDTWKASTSTRAVKFNLINNSLTTLSWWLTLLCKNPRNSKALSSYSQKLQAWPSTLANIAFFSWILLLLPKGASRESSVIKQEYSQWNIWVSRSRIPLSGNPPGRTCWINFMQSLTTGPSDRSIFLADLHWSKQCFRRCLSTSSLHWRLLKRS